MSRCCGKRKTIDGIDDTETITVEDTAKFGDGTQSEPSVTFINDDDTGIYRVGVNTIGIATNGTKRLQIDADSVDSTVQILGPAGTSSAPSFSFTTDPDTGFFSTGANQFGITAGTTTVVSGSTSGVTTTVPIRASDGAATLPSLSFANLTGAGLYNETATANTMGIATGNTKRGQLNSSGLAMSVPITTTNATDSSSTSTGSIITSGGLAVVKNVVTGDQILAPPAKDATEPAYSFLGAAATGFHLDSSVNPAISVGGTTNVVFEGARASFNGQVRTSNGTDVDPTYTFTADSDTGMYRIGSDNLGLSTGGAKRLDISSTRITSTVPFIGSSFSDGFTTTTASATPIVLTVSSNGIQEIQGFTDQTIQLPDATTLTVGRTFEIRFITTTTGQTTPTKVLTVKDGSGATLTTITGSNESFRIVLTNNSTAAGTWDFFDQSGTSGSVVSAGAVKNQDGQIVGATGTVGFPSFTFDGDTDTGMYNGAAGQINFTTNGGSRLSITSAATTVQSTQQRNPTGSAATPSYSFSADTNTGLYSLGDTLGIGVSIDGTLTRSIAPTSETTTVVQLGPAGSASNPTYSYSGDSNTGWYQTGTADTIGLSTNGTNRLTVNTATFSVNLPCYTTDGAAGTPSYSFNSDPNTGVYRIGNDNMGLSAGGTNALDITATRINNALPMRGLDGVFNAPAYSFSNSTSTGMWSGSAGILNFSGGGVGNLQMSSTKIEPLVQTQNILGAVGTPSYSFTGDSDTGIYEIGADNIGVATGGVKRLDISSTNLESSIPAIAPSGSGYGTNTAITAAGTTTTLTVASTGVQNVTGDANQTIKLPDATTLKVGHTYRLIFSTGTGPTTATLRTFAVVDNGSNSLKSVSVLGYKVSVKLTANGTSNGTWIFTDEWFRDSSSGTYETFALPQLGPAGSVTAPTYSFSGAESNSGMYQSSTDTIRFAANGTNIVSMTDTNLIMTNGRIQLNAGTVGAPGINFGNSSTDSDTGFYRLGANNCGIAAGASAIMDWSTTGTNTTLPIFTAAGAVGAPSYTFTGDTDTGMYAGGADKISFTTGGTERMNIQSTAIILAQPTQFTTGSASAPGLAPSGDPNTGIFSNGNDDLSFSTNATQRLQISTGNITSTLPVVFPSYTVVGVPSASPAGQFIYVSNESGGAVMAFSDATNWRRVTDRAIIS